MGKNQVNKITAIALIMELIIFTILLVNQV